MAILQGYGVFRLILVIVLCGAGLAAAWPVTAQEWSHSPVNWLVIGKGMKFAQFEVYEDRDLKENLAVVHIDPNYHGFRVFHGQPRRITAWQEAIGAQVVFNASYYTPRGDPCGLIIADGKLIGPLHNSAMRGMFVSEPKGVSPDLPRATILDLLASPIHPKKLPWTQGVQSFPLLLDFQGRIRVKKTDLVAQRTVIAADRNGNILVFHSAGDFFTLHDLAKFLKSSKLDIDSALNLDGGSKAQLLVRTGEFSFTSPSFLEQRARELFDSQTSLLPTVIGVFARDE